MELRVTLTFDMLHRSRIGAVPSSCFLFQKVAGFDRPLTALDLAIAEINTKTDLNIAIESLERSLHRRVTTLTFVMKAQSTRNVIQEQKRQLEPTL